MTPREPHSLPHPTKVLQQMKDLCTKLDTSTRSLFIEIPQRTLGENLINFQFCRTLKLIDAFFSLFPSSIWNEPLCVTNVLFCLLETLFMCEDNSLFHTMRR